jgi:hypothetical protein
LSEDEIPDTLKTLLRRVTSDYLPEIEAMIAFQNDYLKTAEISEGDLVGGKESARQIGFCDFTWREQKVTAMVMPYRVFLLQRIQDAYDAMAENERESVDALLSETGLSAILAARSTRRVDRKDNREIWGPLTH